MFTEYEVEVMIEDEIILEAIQNLKKDFIKKEARFLDISDHDFLSLIFLTPTLGVALANDDVNLKEELALNKKARKLSKGNYFLKKDPVVTGMQFCIKNYNYWEEHFLSVIRTVMDRTMNLEDAHEITKNAPLKNLSDYKKVILICPYILVRYICAFFLEEDEDIFTPRPIKKSEFDVLKELGQKLKIDHLPIFKGFCEFTFNVS
ncbi:MAG: hypothetical protein AAF363_17115 [Bacteroidota bacterium]